MKLLISILLLSTVLFAQDATPTPAPAPVKVNPDLAADYFKLSSQHNNILFQLEASYTERQRQLFDLDRQQVLKVNDALAKIKADCTKQKLVLDEDKLKQDVLVCIIPKEPKK